MAIVRDMAAALENGKSLNEILENMTFNKRDASPKNEEENNHDLSVRVFVHSFHSATEAGSKVRVVFCVVLCYRIPMR